MKTLHVAVIALLLTPVLVAAKGPPPVVRWCHYDADTQAWSLVRIARPAVDRGHAPHHDRDAAAGQRVPGQANSVFTDNCVPELIDTDGDGVTDDADNCPADANPDQVDLDDDGHGNACDDDLDGDTVPNDVEVNLGQRPDVFNGQDCRDATQAIGPGADLRGCVLTGSDLTSAALSGADLTGAELSGAELSGADLSGAQLPGAVLPFANLSGANLTGANLSSAVLTFADLTSAELTFAGMKGADLTGAVLISADVTFADLTDANLTGANLTGADLTLAVLNGVTWDGAICPDGTMISDGAPCNVVV